MSANGLTWQRKRFPTGLTFYVGGRYRIEPVTSPSKKLARTGYGANGERGYVVTGWRLYRDDRVVCGYATLRAAKARAERDLHLQRSQA